jgi:hypothetical protein
MAESKSENSITARNLKMNTVIKLAIADTVLDVVIITAILILM